MRRWRLPDTSHHAFLAACYAQLGATAAAKRHVGEVLAREPAFSTDTYLATQTYYAHETDREHHRAALLKAGLPA